MNDLPDLSGPMGHMPVPPHFLPWWQKARWVLPLLWLVPPIGLLMLWRGKRFSKRAKIIITVVLGLVMLPRWITLPSTSNPTDIVTNSQPVAPPHIGPLNVEITVTTKVANGLLYMEAKTNLPDSTLISTSLFRDFSGDRYWPSSKATVTNGKFKGGPFSYEGNPLPAGDYELSVTTLVTRMQPKSVQATFGKKGENLTGPLVSDAKYGFGRTAKVELIVTVNDSDSRRQLSEVATSKESYRNELATLYDELMDFKNDPYFHEIGFSPGATRFKQWQNRLEALQKQKAYSNRGAVAASELFELAREYRRSRGAETKYSNMVTPNMMSVINATQ
ncbi:MAG: hypothetical protein V4672_13270 [Verrucomicrobiota bacterium]